MQWKSAVKNLMKTDWDCSDVLRSARVKLVFNKVRLNAFACLF